jgi:anti-sigma regulatory factor (Ser/Thr protein kinase)
MMPSRRPDDRLDLELRSEPGMLPAVREQLRRWAERRGWPDDRVAEIILAVDEALSNVIRHAYGSAATQPILLVAERTADADQRERIEIRIRDFGRAVDPADIRGRDLTEIRPGGLGVHLIRAMMSSVEYAPANGGGTLLIMRKYKDHCVRPQRSEANP